MGIWKRDVGETLSDVKIGIMLCTSFLDAKGFIRKFMLILDILNPIASTLPATAMAIRCNLEAPFILKYGGLTALRILCLRIARI